MRMDSSTAPHGGNARESQNAALITSWAGCARPGGAWLRCRSMARYPAGGRRRSVQRPRRCLVTAVDQRDQMRFFTPIQVGCFPRRRRFPSATLMSSRVRRRIKSDSNSCGSRSTSPCYEDTDRRRRQGDLAFSDDQDPRRASGSDACGEVRPAQGRRVEISARACGATTSMIDRTRVGSSVTSSIV